MTDFTMHSDLPLSCALVESLASEWVDGALSPELRAGIEAHLDACEACANLVADLAAIASEARALPRLEPSRDLWNGIAARIATPVVALPSRGAVAVASDRWWKAAVAAAALVAVTAGVTWRLAIGSVQERTASTAPAPASSPAAPGNGIAPVLATTSAPDSGPATVVAPAQVAVREPRATSGTRQASVAGPRRSAVVVTPAVTPVAAAPLPLAAQAYDREIAGMRAIVTQRGKDLDPTTVRVLERNLRIIDQAIAESRAALAQDPASGLLAEQLTRAMKRKLELLRSAADLPARIS